MIAATANSKCRPPRKLEQRLRAIIVQLLPDCEVCGRRMEAKFLRPFPGAPDKLACGHCITELTADE